LNLNWANQGKIRSKVLKLTKSLKTIGSTAALVFSSCAVGRKISSFLILGLVLAIEQTPGVAQSTTSQRRPTSLATFEGQVIDLSKGWGRAQVCSVLGLNDVRCYASSVEALAAEVRAAKPNLTQSQALETARAQEAAVTQASQPNCPSSWVCLYDGASWDGRRLQFKSDLGKWQSLITYGFEKKTSSWANTRSKGFGLCKNAVSGSTPCPSNLYIHFQGNARSSVMPSGWDNAAQSVGLDG
jgi:hypothetical protein